MFLSVISLYLSYLGFSDLESVGWWSPSVLANVWPILLKYCFYPIPFGEGSGTPLQHSCLENPMDGGAWWAAVHGVAKSRTRLSDFTFMHWRRKWQHTPVFLPGESQGRQSLVGCHPWGRRESDTTEATLQQQQLIPFLSKSLIS